ncbi:hypothetical protein RyT2_17210 [Pseudolactococcus yaeyamensis]
MVQRDYTQNNGNSDFQFEVTEKIAVLDRGRNGWTTELNKVSYNGGDSKFDLRTWNPNGGMGKGIVLRDEVANNLFLALADYFGDKLNEGNEDEETPHPLEATMPNDFNNLVSQAESNE